eukprot:3801790-Pyramimonas_sp.AAC.1
MRLLDYVLQTRRLSEISSYRDPILSRSSRRSIPPLSSGPRGAGHPREASGQHGRASLEVHLARDHGA